MYRLKEERLADKAELSDRADSETPKEASHGLAGTPLRRRPSPTAATNPYDEYAWCHSLFCTEFRPARRILDLHTGQFPERERPVQSENPWRRSLLHHERQRYRMDQVAGRARDRQVVSAGSRWPVHANGH